ncbi:MAG: hypothetical protein DSY38_04670 [Fusobacteria bacterium]|nr:MAG: hypothetical protein DSY38_04670 [Fusobacteriota bacterium]
MKDKSLKLIPGVGKKTQEILSKHNILKISDVLKVSLQELRSILGYNRGEMIYEYSRGIDNRKISSKSKTHSISNEGTYSLPLEDEDVIFQEFSKLLIKTHKRLVKNSSYTKTLSIKIRYEDRKIITRSKSFNKNTQDLELLEKTMKEILEEIDFEKKIKLLGINLSNLSKNKKQQLSFESVEKIGKIKIINQLQEKINKI